MVNIHARRKPKEAPKNPEVAIWPGEADSLRPDSKYPSYVRDGIQRSKRDRKFMRAILGPHCTRTILAEQDVLRTLPLYSFLPRGEVLYERNRVLRSRMSVPKREACSNTVNEKALRGSNVTSPLCRTSRY